jgi:hypothetical protein
MAFCTTLYRMKADSEERDEVFMKRLARCLLDGKEAAF